MSHGHSPRASLGGSLDDAAARFERNAPSSQTTSSLLGGRLGKSSHFVRGLILVVVFVRRLGARGKEGESGATRRTALAQGVSVGGTGRACFRAESRGDGIIAASEVLVAVDAAGALGNGIINEARELAACQWVPPTLELFRTRT